MCLPLRVKEIERNAVLDFISFFQRYWAVQFDFLFDYDIEKKLELCSGKLHRFTEITLLRFFAMGTKFNLSINQINSD